MPSMCLKYKNGVDMLSFWMENAPTSAYIKTAIYRMKMQVFDSGQ